MKEKNKTSKFIIPCLQAGVLFGTHACFVFDIQIL